MALQQRTNSAGLPVQGRKSQMLPFCFPIAQIGIDPLLRLPQCSPAKRFDERGKVDYWIFTASIYLRCFRWSPFLKGEHCVRDVPNRTIF
jgi:hypothetical protein